MRQDNIRYNAAWMASPYGFYQYPGEELGCWCGRTGIDKDKIGTRLRRGDKVTIGALDITSSELGSATSERAEEVEFEALT